MTTNQNATLEDLRNFLEEKPHKCFTHVMRIFSCRSFCLNCKSVIHTDTGDPESFLFPAVAVIHFYKEICTEFSGSSCVLKSR